MPAMLPACDGPPALVTASPCCCCSACPQHPSAPAPRPALLPPAPAPGPALVRTVSHRRGTRRRGSTFNSPLTIMLGWHPTSKKSPMPFVPRKTPAWNTRPASTLPKNFISKNPACVASGVWLGPWWHRSGWGWFRRTPGRVVNGGNFCNFSFGTEDYRRRRTERFGSGRGYPTLISLSRCSRAARASFSWMQCGHPVVQKRYTVTGLSWA